MILFRLVFTEFSVHRVRSFLTIAAIALSVSLVVAVTSGYTSADAAILHIFDRFVGAADVVITRQGDTHGGVNQALATVLAVDPDVRHVVGRLEEHLSLNDAEGNPMRAQVIGVRGTEDSDLLSMVVDSGMWFDANSGPRDVAVIDQVAAKRLKLKVGDTFALPGVTGDLHLHVLGIVHKPTIMAMQAQTIYLPLHTLQTFLQKPGQLRRIMVTLKTGVDPDAFSQRWREKVAAIDPQARVSTARENRKQFDKNLQGIEILSYLGGSASMLAATFIVFSALSMGVSERARTLAMLRAIGASRGQLASMVFAEGALLAASGVAIGEPLGLAWVKALTLWKHDFFVAGLVPSWGGILLGAGGSVAAALLASILPAYTATRVDPLEAMAAVGSSARKVLPWRYAVAGLFLISIDLVLQFIPHVPREVRFYGHFAVGLAAINIGFFLLAPMYVWIADKVLARLAARLMGVEPALLRQQLGAGLWRAAGTGAALMVGLAILVVLQVIGHSWLASWTLPDKFPDLFAYSESGLNATQQAALDKLPGLRKEMINGVETPEVLPIAMASPEFGTSMFGIAGASLLPDSTLFLGVDPDRALRMMGLTYREGSAADAARRLKLGHQVIVTEEFRQLKGLHVDDKLTLKVFGGKPVEFTIAAVVWSPGIDVIAGMYDLGQQMEQRTASTVFGSLDDAKRIFGVDTIHLFAVDLVNDGRSKVQIEQDFRKTLRSEGLMSGDVRQIKYGIDRSFSRILALLSSIAFSAMAVAALGVANTIMASVRTRRWQFGILRSIGVTQGQLMRLLIAEGILLGMVGCGLGLSCGWELTIIGNQLGRWMLGYVVPLQVPWGFLAIGVAAVMAVSLLASLWPAIMAAREDPLSLLQAGRAAA